MSNFLDSFEDVEIPKFGLVKLPQITIELKYKQQLKLPENCSNYEFLCALTKKGLMERVNKIPQDRRSEYFIQAEKELEIFEELGFTDYILLVWLVINRVKEKGGFVDFGRGSCSASLVMAALGVTGIVDTLDKGLIFERFVSRTRSKKQIIDGETYLLGELLPDVDLNLGDSREGIIQWLKTLYPNRMCQISTISTLTGKILVKDVFKTVNGASEDESKAVADLIDKHFGIVEDIEKMPERSVPFKNWTEQYPQTFAISLKLRDIIRNFSNHPSGYFLSFRDLFGYTPLVLTKEKELAMAFDMNSAAKLGVKLDLLGLTTNALLRDFFTRVPEKVEDIELETNPIIYDQFKSGKLLPYGLYQISADCAYRVTMDIKPKDIFELSDVNAIARPGALDYLKSYVGNQAECPHPIFKDIVSRSRNHFLYQEQLMRGLIAIGFTADEAEKCRKIVGKKLTEEVKEWEQKIYEKVKENNLPEEIGRVIWKVLNDSAKYSFNKCLSPDTVIETDKGYKMMHQTSIGDKIKAFDVENKVEIWTDVIDVIESKTELYEIELEDGRIIKSSMEHKFLCEDMKMYSLKDIIIHKLRIVTD